LARRQRHLENIIPSIHLAAKAVGKVLADNGKLTHVDARSDIDVPC
jgi:hypothetical protein